MEPGRITRIQDKLLHAEQRLDSFLAWHPEAAHSLKDRLACFKALQEAAEALADVAAMILKDLGTPPHDDYTNLEGLVDAKVITPAMLDPLTELNGLRNALVHDYDGIMDERALAAGARLAPQVSDAIAGVRAWISTSV